MRVCSPALPLTQSILSLLGRNSCLARSPGPRGWNIIDTWMLSASLLCQYVICLLDTSGLEHRFHPTLSKQWLSPSYEARRASPPSPPALTDAPFVHLTCSWLEGREHSEGKAGCMLYCLVLNFYLGNLCTMILIGPLGTNYYKRCREGFHAVRDH